MQIKVRDARKTNGVEIIFDIKLNCSNKKKL